MPPLRRLVPRSKVGETSARTLAVLCACAFAGACARGAAISPPTPTRAHAAAPLATTDAAARICDGAEAVPALRAAGKLHRALLVERQVAARCPSAEAALRGERAILLAELGRYAEAREVAAAAAASHPEAAAEANRIADARDRRFEATDTAKRAMRALYRDAIAADDAGDARRATDLFLQAWDSWHPNGQALYGAGRSAKRAGDAALAQRLFDRAIEELEAGTHARLQLEAPDGFDSATSDVAIAPSGTVVARAGRRDVALFDAKTGRRRSQLTLPADARTVAFSTDGRVVAASDADRHVHIFDVASAELLRTIEGGRFGSPFAIGGSVVAVATSVSAVELGDLATGRRLRAIDAAMRIDALSLLDEDHVLVIASDGALAAFDVATGRPLWREAGADVDRLAAGGRVVAVPRVRGRARAVSEVDLLDARTGRVVRTLPIAKPGALASVAVSVDGRIVAVSTSETFAFDATTGLLLATLPRAARVAVGGGRVALAAEATIERTISAEAFTLELRTIADGTTLAISPKRSERVEVVAFPIDGRSVVLTTSGGGGAIVDGRGVARTPAGCIDETASVRVEAPRGGLRGIAIADRKVLWEYPREDSAATLLCDGDRVLVPRGQRHADVLDDFDVVTAKTGAMIATVQPPSGVIPRPGGHGVFAIGEKGVSIDGMRVDPLLGSGLDVRGASFSANGTLAAAWTEKFVVVIDVASTKLIERYWPMAGAVSGTGSESLECALLSRDGTELVTMSRGSPFGIVVFDRARREVTTLGKGATSFDGHVFAPSWRCHGAIASSPTARVIAATSPHGARLYASDRGELLGELHLVRGRDAAYFVGQGKVQLFGDADDLPICRVGPLSYPFELCAERLTSRDLFARALRGLASDDGADDMPLGP